MSLVNDLLIELDRQKEAEARPPSAFLDGLAPNAPRARERAGRSHALAIFAAAIFVGVGVGVIVAASSESPEQRMPVSARGADLRSDRGVPMDSPGADSPSTATGTPADQDARGRSPAIPSEDIREEAPTPTASTPRTQRVERASTLSSIELEPRATFTRLRLSGDAGLQIQVDRAVSGRRVLITLPRTRLGASLASLDLGQTPITALTTREIDAGIVVELEFDRRVDVRTQRRDSASESIVLVDLDPTRHDRVVRRPEATPAFEASDSALPAPSTTSSPVNAVAPPTAASAAADAGAEPLAIERSASDRRRHARERAHERATRSVVAARIARDEGRTNDADRLFAEALAAAPDHRDAIVGRVELFVERDRPDEAIALLHEARRLRATDAGLAMLHARIVADGGRIADAVRLLDGAALGVDVAPELHAMAAALLQRAGDHADAIDRFEAVVRRHPSESRWWMGLGISLEAQARPEEALDVYRIAMQVGALSRPSREWITSRVDDLSQEDD